MSTYTLKSVVRRGTMLGLAVALGLATVLPAASTFADALNPLTERSLTLSSGSPGWNFKDASGNATYAPPNSGANGKKTGNTFSFRVSSGTPLSAMTFQYCIQPAGDCMAPGDIAKVGTPGSYTRATNAAAEASKTSDLEIVTDTATPANVKELDPSTYASKFDATTGQPKAYNPPDGYDPDTIHPSMPLLNGTEGNFIVLHRADTSSPWVQSTDWSMAASVRQTTGGNGTAGTVANGTSTGKNNLIKISNTGSQALNSGDYVKVIFFATNDTYITNPGSKEFFVKINTYNHATDENDSTLVDGGVTVANVMNRSIEIQTKVLETMQFSVGTVDPNTLDSTDGATSPFADATGKTQHTTCDPIAQGMQGTDTAKPNVLQLGDASSEFSLRTDTTYSTHSYWRLSSNSSGGATVYYSGVTLSNTVGDQIKPIGKSSATPAAGSEQFGLALDNGVDEDAGTAGVQSPNGLVSYAKEREGTDHLFQNGADNDVTGVHATTTAAVGSNGSWHEPRLFPLTPKADYGFGTGVVNVVTGNPFGYTDNTAASYAKFAFDPDSNTIPTPFADGNQVLDCVTGKMRYIANIAATTPAGIYTTKINYIAAPKY